MITKFIFPVMWLYRGILSHHINRHTHTVHLDGSTLVNAHTHTRARSLHRPLLSPSLSPFVLLFFITLVLRVCDMWCDTRAVIIPMALVDHGRWFRFGFSICITGISLQRRRSPWAQGVFRFLWLLKDISACRETEETRRTRSMPLEHVICSLSR